MIVLHSIIYHCVPFHHKIAYPLHNVIASHSPPCLWYMLVVTNRMGGGAAKGRGGVGAEGGSPAAAAGDGCAKAASGRRQPTPGTSFPATCPPLPPCSPLRAVLTTTSQPVPRTSFPTTTTPRRHPHYASCSQPRPSWRALPPWRLLPTKVRLI